MLFILSIILLGILFLVSWISLIREWNRVNISGPTPFPIIGNILSFLGDGTELLPIVQKIHEKHGDAAQAFLLGERYVGLFHPKHCEKLLPDVNYISKGKSYDFLKPWLGNGLLTAKGNRWKSHRKFLTPAFHFNILQNVLPIFIKNDKILVDKLNGLADGRNVDLFPIIALTALDNVAEAVMGVSFEAQNNSDSKYVKAINDLSLIIASKMRNPLLGIDSIFYWTPMKKKQDNALLLLNEHTNRVIKSRRQTLEELNITELNNNSRTGTKNKHAFLDLLLLSQVDGHKIADDSIREEVETFMFEGHDTTSSGIVFTFYCISQHEDVQRKILDEQKAVLGEDIFRDPTYNDLKQMKYLELIIKESLRLYPSVPLIQRRIEHDTEIGGLRLVRDTNVVLSIFHMHRNPDVYDSPLEFRPERFENERNKNPFDWLSFSAGPRNCIGQKFAMMEMKVTIASIVKHFRLLPSNIEPQLCADLILRSVNGVHVQLIPRQ